jgi:hypothetical protein
MLKFHNKNCSICKRAKPDEVGHSLYGFKEGIYLGNSIRICKICYDMIPYHIPPQQIVRYVERLVEGKDDTL